MLRYTLGGRESTYQIGVYPEVKAEEARQKAGEARKLVGEGRHPSVERKLDRAKNVERSQATFRAVADEWLAHHRAHWSAVHHERNEGLLRRILFPKLGALPVDAISEPMLLNVLRTAYDSGTKESARRARGVAAQVFAYAKDTHRATHNPARELARSTVLRKPEVRHFAAIKPKQVGSLLAKLDRGGVEPATRAALLLMLYTGLRDYSLRAARWGEIDLKGKTWTVPRERMKRKVAHTVPLPKQAVAVLRELRGHTEKAPDSFVFASNSKEGFLAENTLRIALHRLGFKVTAHGFRSLLTDVLNEQGFNADAIERQLHHAERNQVRAAYLRSEFLDHRHAMMQWFADWCEAQKSGSRTPALPKNVVPFRRVA
jgi:integrase